MIRLGAGHYRIREAEAQRGEVTSSGSHSKLGAESGFVPELE